MADNNTVFPQPSLPIERPEAEPKEEIDKVEESEPEPSFVTRDFTIEQMAFIRSLQEHYTSRMTVIQAIQYCISRSDNPDEKQMLDDAQNLLGCMTDEEYNSYNFEVDFDEPRIYEY